MKGFTWHETRGVFFFSNCLDLNPCHGPTGYIHERSSAITRHNDPLLEQNLCLNTREKSNQTSSRPPPPKSGGYSAFRPDFIRLPASIRVRTYTPCGHIFSSHQPSPARARQIGLDSVDTRPHHPPLPGKSNVMHKISLIIFQHPWHPCTDRLTPTHPPLEKA